MQLERNIVKSNDSRNLNLPRRLHINVAVSHNTLQILNDFSQTHLGDRRTNKT